jgi:cytochrome c biogenesis protein CcmG/thiol:disulfide interchange protein DsbE
VTVWASWCLPCREDAPLLARLARTYEGTIDFRGINVEDRRGDARAFVRRYRLDFPHLFDPRARTAEALGFFGLPTLYLVDGRRRIAARLVGKQPAAVLRRLVRMLAEEPT